MTLDENYIIKLFDIEYYKCAISNNHTMMNYDDKMYLMDLENRIFKNCIDNFHTDFKACNKIINHLLDVYNLSDIDKIEENNSNIEDFLFKIAEYGVERSKDDAEYIPLAYKYVVKLHDKDLKDMFLNELNSISKQKKRDDFEDYCFLGLFIILYIYIVKIFI